MQINAYKITVILNIIPLQYMKVNCLTENKEITFDFFFYCCMSVHLRPTAVWRWDEVSHDKESKTYTHTHRRKERKENPLMGEMREVVGSVTAWL